MKLFIYQIFFITIITLILDIIYFFSIKKHFLKLIQDIQHKPLKVKWEYVILSYLTLIFTIYYFVIKDSKDLLYAFILGSTIYSIYELTNMAIFEKWNYMFLIIEFFWGGILFTLTTFLTNYLINFFFDKIKQSKKTFYVCSYGGCGSTILYKYLKNYGKSEHVHSRYPPNKLTEVGGFHHEWFNDTLIPENKIDDVYVIYIYRDPIHSIYSRFNHQHLYNIQVDPGITYQDIYNTNKDLYNIEEFFDNYTTPNKDRNYKIICVKYEELFSRYNELLSLLGIEEIIPFPEEKITKREYVNEKQLRNIYSNLKNKMDQMDFITIV